MSTSATLAGGATLVLAQTNLVTQARLRQMQADMDWLASGRLPIKDVRGGTATAADVVAYLSGPRKSVRDCV